jgi:hypothetical protein
VLGGLIGLAALVFGAGALALTVGRGTWMRKAAR